MTHYHQLFRYRPLFAWISALSVSLALLLSPALFAASGIDAWRPVEFQSNEIGPERAAAIVQAKVEGKVLSVSSGTRNGKPVYRVKVLLTGGRVKVIPVSALDGQLLD